MNPHAILAIVIAFFVVISVAGVQTYRLQGSQAEVKTLEQEKAEAKRLAQVKALHDAKNKERTDEEYRAALARAHAAGVRSQPVGIVSGTLSDAGGGQNPAGCVSGEQLAGELAGFAKRNAERLTAVLTSVAERHAERLSGNSAAAEEVAAAYRACSVFAKNLSAAQ